MEVLKVVLFHYCKQCCYKSNASVVNKDSIVKLWNKVFQTCSKYIGKGWAKKLSDRLEDCAGVLGNLNNGNDNNNK